MKTIHTPAILGNKHLDEPSVFRPENLLREARRQRSLPVGDIPKICLLDPDGDLTDYLIAHGLAKRNEFWACYHSKLFDLHLGDTVVGIIPCIVGSSYAVLVAEQAFVSGCELLLSVTSAGRIGDEAPEKPYALITESVRDEGTSYHYLDPGKQARLSPKLQKIIGANAISEDAPYFEAKSWTTDAPYRETNTAITNMGKEGIRCVEMEAAALYAFAEAKGKDVICFAHLTNTMAQQEGDFEKGEFFGSLSTLNIVRFVIEKLS